MSFKVRDEAGTEHNVSAANLEAAAQDGFLPVVSDGNQEHRVTSERMGQALSEGWRPIGELNEEDDSFLGGLMGGVQAVGEFFDKYTGAPTRKAIHEAQMGRDPISGFTGQFGEDPSLAPTGQDIAEKAGVPDTSLNVGLTSYTNPKTGITVPIREEDAPTLQEAAGLGIDIAADPVNLIPGAVLAKPFTKGAQGIRGIRRMIKGGEGVAEAGAKAKATAKVGPVTVEQRLPLKPPESLEELKNWRPRGADSDLVSSGRLRQIEKSVPDLEYRPLNYHHDMLANPKKMKELKLKFENLPTEDAQNIAAYHQAMVNEATEKLNETVYRLSNDNPMSLTDAGYNFVETAKTQYLAEKEALGPLFQEIQRRSGALNVDAAQDLIVNLGENSKIGKLLAQNPDTGRLTLTKNTPRTGLSDKEYGILSRLVDDLNDGMTFPEMQAARDFLRKAIDPMNPKETAEIAKVRSLMLGQMEEMSGRFGDDVGNVFKKYAINEKSREAVEKIIGGKIDTLDSMFAANPDKVVKKIFSNPKYAEVIKTYIGAEKYQELVGSFIQNGVTRATDSVHGFSPHKFKTWLKSNHQFLQANLAPDEMERVLALTDYAVMGKKFIADVNPSGTAASLHSMVDPKGLINKIKVKGAIAGVTSEAASRVAAVTSRRSAKKAVDAAMSGAPKPPPKPFGEGTARGLEKIGEAVTERPGLSKAAYTAARVSSTENKGKDKFIRQGHERIVKVGGSRFKDLIHSDDKEVQSLLMRASSKKISDKMLANIIKKLEKKMGEQ